jgi:hypothetical protein
MKQENNIYNIMIENIISYNYYIIIVLIKLEALINILSLIEDNKFDFYYFQSSKISLKIKGVGENKILGNFSNFNCLKEVYINGNKQDKINNKYYFN